MWVDLTLENLLSVMDEVVASIICTSHRLFVVVCGFSEVMQMNWTMFPRSKVSSWYIASCLLSEVVMGLVLNHIYVISHRAKVGELNWIGIMLCVCVDVDWSVNKRWRWF